MQLQDITVGMKCTIKTMKLDGVSGDYLDRTKNKYFVTMDEHMVEVQAIEGGTVTVVRPGTAHREPQTFRVPYYQIKPYVEPPSREAIMAEARANTEKRVEEWQENQAKADAEAAEKQTAKMAKMRGQVGQNQAARKAKKKENFSVVPSDEVERPAGGIPLGLPSDPVVAADPKRGYYGANDTYPSERPGYVPPTAPATKTEATYEVAGGVILYDPAPMATEALEIGKPYLHVFSQKHDGVRPFDPKVVKLIKITPNTVKVENKDGKTSFVYAYDLHAINRVLRPGDKVTA